MITITEKKANVGVGKDPVIRNIACEKEME